MCKIAILENYSLFCSGIKPILEDTKEFKIVAEGKHVEDLLQQFGEEKPNVIIVDIIHCENEGIKPIKKIRRAHPRIPILLVVSEDYANFFEEYIALGVRGFVFKSADAEELVKAVVTLKNGKDYFRKNVWALLKEFIRSRRAGRFAKEKKSILTIREKDVLKQFCKGLTYKEIGANLHISHRTVESHKKNILKKLNLNSTAEMVKYALSKQIM